MKLHRRARLAITVGIVAAAAAVLAATAVGGTSRSDGRPRITVMVGGQSKIIYALSTLAHSLGYYDKAGIDTYTIDEPAGIEAADALVAGQINAAMGYYVHTIDLATKGKCTQAVITMGLTPGHAVVVPPNSSISSPADFKGKTLGITGTGASTDYELQYLAQRKGVNPSDFTRLPVGAGSTFIASLQHGQIDGGITSQPTIQTLVAAGQAKILVDLQSLVETEKAFGGPWPSTSIYMTCDFVQHHPDQVQKLVNAYVWTLKWLKTATSAQIAAKMPSTYAPKGDMNLYVQAIDASRTFFSPTGLMPKVGPKVVEKTLQLVEPDAAKVDLSKTYTNAFVLKALKTKVPPPRGG